MPAGLFKSLSGLRAVALTLKESHGIATGGGIKTGFALSLIMRGCTDCLQQSF